MILKKLKLRNFRNIEHCEIHLDPGINVFLGNNGQGKTNCIESVMFSSTTRSFRVLNDNAMIKYDCPFASIECTVEDEGKKFILSSVIHSKGKSLFISSKYFLDFSFILKTPFLFKLYVNYSTYVFICQ